MNIDGYFQSMGNAIAKERTGLQIIIADGENALTMWGIYSTMKSFNPHFRERGEPVAANLRGSLKSSGASPRHIESLTADLRWFTKKGLELWT